MGKLLQMFVDFSTERGTEIQDLLIGGITAFTSEHPRWIVSETGSLPLQGTRVSGGMITWGLSRRNDELRRRHRLPVVNLFDYCRGCKANIVIDNAAVGAMAAEHFLNQGLKRFAYVGCPDWYWSVAREQAYAGRLGKEGHRCIAFNERLAKHLDTQQRVLGFHARVAGWLLALPKPIGVFCCHDDLAHRVLNSCQLISARVPHEIAVLGVNNSSVHCRSTQPHLSSVIIPWEAIGYRAAEWLDRLIRREAPPEGGRLVIQPRDIQRRQSTDFTAADEPGIAAALHFIRANACKPVSVADVADAVRLNRRRLEILFRRILNRTLFDEIRRVQIEHAKQLLGSTDLIVSVVAEQSGLSAQRFYSVFRAETGLTPSAYRKQYKVFGWKVPKR